MSIPAPRRGLDVKKKSCPVGKSGQGRMSTVLRHMEVLGYVKPGSTLDVNIIAAAQFERAAV
jgi:hypothetical protein